MVLVGISCSHDASACVVVDGVLRYAIQLERLTGVKHDGRPFLNSARAVDYCLAAAGLARGDVDLFCFNSQNLLPQQVGLGFPLRDRGFDLFDPCGPRSLFVTHHLAHAFAAFFTSPFDEAGVMVVDGSGGSVVGADDLILTGPELADYVRREVSTPRPAYHAESIYRFSSEGFELVDRHAARSFHPMCGSSSLGETYAAVSQYVFGDWMDGGKLMGLAPYGNADRFGPPLLARDGEGRLQFTSGWKLPLDAAERREAPLAYADLAARIQADLETAIVDRAARCVALTGSRRLAYSGGVALNSVANQRIVEHGHVEALHVMPASHDAGICVGAAAVGWFHLTGRTRGSLVRSDCLGRRYSVDEVDSALAPWRPWLRIEAADDAALAAILAEGLIVARFAGGSEFGPRALGHRSILAAPFERAMWTRLNARVKYREEFRPYAPLVAAEVAERYFEMGADPCSPYMLRIVRVRPEWRERLGAVTHVNGTARVQTVDQIRSPGLHAILWAFADRTGDPLLINTSLNVRGRPIVETPAQAFEMLLSTGLEALHINGRLLRRHDIAPEALGRAWIRLAPATRTLAEGYSGKTVFSILSDAQGGVRRPLSRHLFKMLAEAEELCLNDLPPDLGRTAAAELLREVEDLIEHNLVLARPGGHDA